MSITDLDVARADRAETNIEITPVTLLRVALRDCQEWGDVTKCYITLIRDDGTSWKVENYRANLTRAEEVAYRQLGVHENIENWRKG